jgi:hypothetical protein
MKTRLDFLPVTALDVQERGWSEVDFVYVTGDAYVDHPSFGISIISRVLEADGFRVAVLSQPDYKTTKDFMRFGRPRLGFLVSSGNIDSMVAHYTVSKKKRNAYVREAGEDMGFSRAGKITSTVAIPLLCFFTLYGLAFTLTILLA